MQILPGLLFCACCLSSCISFENRAYLHPEDGEGFKILSFNTGIKDTVVFGVANDSLAHLYGLPTSLGVELSYYMSVASGHTVRFDSPTVRVACGDLNETALAIPEVIEERIVQLEGLGPDHFQFSRSAEESFTGGMWTNDPTKIGTFSTGVYSFKLHVAGCRQPPVKISMPDMLSDGRPLKGISVTFHFARARKLDLVPVQ